MEQFAGMRTPICEVAGTSLSKFTWNWILHKLYELKFDRFQFGTTWS